MILKVWNKVNSIKSESRRLQVFFQKQYRKELNTISKLNILLIGQTNVEKSIFIEHIFGKDFTGLEKGKPISQHLLWYEKEGCAIRLFMVRDLELNSETTTALLQEINQIISRYQEASNLNQLFHIAWYCTDSTVGELEQFEMSMMDGLAIYMPVIHVLARDFCDSIRLKDLVLKTLRVLPEVKKNAFLRTQIVNLELKRQYAKKIVRDAMLANSAIGMAPIPFSDAPLIINSQIKMLVKISIAFNGSYDEIYKNVVPALYGVTGAALAGESIVSGLLKIIPGAGWVIGGAMSAATSAALTGALGYAYIEVMCKVEEKKIATGMPFTNAELLGMLTNAFRDALQSGKFLHRKVTIRPALPTDAATLTDISFAAKRYWDYPEEYYRIWTPELTITEEYIAENVVYKAMEENEIVGYYSLVEVSDDFWAGKVFVSQGWWLEHVYIRPQNIGQGIGTQLMAHCKAQCLERGIDKIKIFADPHATGFYDKLGAEYIEQSPSSIPGREVALYKMIIKGS